jgi:hypothetical protein
LENQKEHYQVSVSTDAETLEPSIGIPTAHTSETKKSNRMQEQQLSPAKKHGQSQNMEDKELSDVELLSSNYFDHLQELPKNTGRQNNDSRP